MAKQADPSRFPAPPKPTFPVEIVPPSNTGFGGGSGSFGGNGDFRSMFLKFMKEAGEALGKSAAEEIEKVKLSIEGGDHHPPGQPLSGSSPAAKKPNQSWVAQMFARAVGMSVPMTPGGLGMFAGRQAANFMMNAPQYAASHAESQRRFANVSPSMASSFAENDVRNRMRDLKSGETLAPSNRELLRELAKFRDSAAQWTDFVTWAKNVGFESVMTGINSLLNPLTEMAFGKRQSPVRLPWENRMIELADKANREADRKAWREQIQIPAGGNPNVPPKGPNG